MTNTWTIHGCQPGHVGVTRSDEPVRQRTVNENIQEENRGIYMISRKLCIRACLNVFVSRG